MRSPQDQAVPGARPHLVNAPERPAEFGADLAERICHRLASGERLKTICEDPSMPTLATVSSWVLEDTEGFAGAYERARRVQAFAWADEILDIADNGHGDWKETARGYSADTDHIQRAKLRVDARKWLLSKLLPGQFGDSLSLGTNETSPVKVTIVQYGDDHDTQ